MNSGSAIIGIALLAALILAWNAHTVAPWTEKQFMALKPGDPGFYRDSDFLSGAMQSGD